MKLNPNITETEFFLADEGSYFSFTVELDIKLNYFILIEAHYHVIKSNISLRRILRKINNSYKWVIFDDESLKNTVLYSEIESFNSYIYLSVT